MGTPAFTTFDFYQIFNLPMAPAAVALPHSHLAGGTPARMAVTVWSLS